MLLSPDIIAALAAAAAAFIVGFLWHGPLFGKLWMTLMNIPQAEADAAKAKGPSGMAPQLVCSFLQQLVVAFVFAHLMNGFGITEMAKAIMLAVILWFGFIATTLLNTVLWEKRPPSLYILNIGYHLTALVTIAIVLTLL